MAREYLHPIFTTGLPTYEGCDCALYYEAIPSRSYYRLHVRDLGLRQGATKYTPRYQISREYLDVSEISIGAMEIAVEESSLPPELFCNPAELLARLFDMQHCQVEKRRTVTNAREALIKWRKDVLAKISELRQGARGSELNNKGTAIKVLRTAA